MCGQTSWSPRHEQPYDNQSGVLATAGGLVFTATLDGGVVALNDETLEEMWRFDTGIVGVKAPVFTFSVDDKQYVAVVAGGRSGAVQAPTIRISPIRAPAR